MLDKYGLTTLHVVLDLEDATRTSPALREEFLRCRSAAEREELAFGWFDHHPQPENRTEWTTSRYGGWMRCDSDDPDPPRRMRTPDWPNGWLPRLEGGEADDHPGRPAGAAPGAKSRWRRADLETIFVKQPGVSARKLAASGDLVESIHHQRISELRSRGDVGIDENGRLKLPRGVTAEGNWITLPKRG